MSFFANIISAWFGITGSTYPVSPVTSTPADPASSVTSTEADSSVVSTKATPASSVTSAEATPVSVVTLPDSSDDHVPSRPVGTFFTGDRRVNLPGPTGATDERFGVVRAVDLGKFDEQPCSIHVLPDELVERSDGTFTYHGHVVTEMTPCGDYFVIRYISNVHKYKFTLPDGATRTEHVVLDN